MLIYTAVFWFFVETCTCQILCTKETFDKTKFSINVTKHIKVESGNCIQIPYSLTFQKNKVVPPYRKTWFEGSPLNVVNTETVDKVEPNRKHILRMSGLPVGEYQYGFKLEWGCNQSYVFPEQVKISVSPSKLEVIGAESPLMEGKLATLQCIGLRHSCSSRPQFQWKWTTPEGQPRENYNYDYYLYRRGDIMRFFPNADDHNSNVTCVAAYNFGTINRSLTLNVKFAPKIQRDSQCVVKGKLLVCVCTSRGNPLAPIRWPSVSPTDYTVQTYSAGQTVTSTVNFLAANYHNTTVKCFSCNEVGQNTQDIPIQNLTTNLINDPLDPEQSSSAVLPWLTAVSFCLNVILLVSLIAYICKQRKSKKKTRDQKTDIYASLGPTDTSVYSVISPQHQ